MYKRKLICCTFFVSRGGEVDGYVPMREEGRKARRVLDSFTCRREKVSKRHVRFWVVLRAGERK